MAVATLIPPPVDALPAPMNIRTEDVTSVPLASSSIAKLLKPAVRKVTL